MNYKLEDIQVAKQKAMLTSKIYIHDEDEFIDHELDENCFTGYFKLLARAINNLQEKNIFVDEHSLVEFLIENKCYRENIVIEVLATSNIPYSVFKHYEDGLKQDYLKTKLKGANNG